MAENINSIGSGLSGLAKRDVALPAGTGVESDWHSGSTLESYVLPSNLRMDAKDTNLALSGIEVIKVSKVRIRSCCILINCDTSYAHLYYSVLH
jgi:hypothetical protein